MLVDVDLAVADHLGGLRTRNDRPRRDGRRRIGQVGTDEFVAAHIGRTGIRIVPRAIGLCRQMMRAAQHDVLLVLGVVVVPGQRHQLARGQADGVAGGVIMVVLGPPAIHRHRRQGHPVALRVVFAGMFEVLEFPVLELCVALLFRHQIGRRLLEVVIVELDLAGGEAAFRRPLVEVFLAHRVGVRARNIGTARARHIVVGGGGVGEHQLLLVVAELVVIADAVFLPSAGRRNRGRFRDAARYIRAVGRSVPAGPRRGRHTRRTPS